MIEVAQNVKLFDKLNKPHLEEKPDSYSRSTKAQKPAKPLTGKAAAAEDRRKKAEAKKQLAKKSDIWARRFRRSCLARQTSALHSVISSLPWWQSKTRFQNPWIGAAAESLGCTMSDGDYCLSALIACSDDTSCEQPLDVPRGYSVLDRLWRILVWNQVIRWPCGKNADKLPDRLTPEPPRELSFSVEWSGNDEEIDIRLKIADCSLSGHWAEIANDPPEYSLVTEFVKRHTSDQLVDLAAAKTKGAKVSAIVSAHSEKNPLPVPEVLNPKRTNKRRRPR